MDFMSFWYLEIDQKIVKHILYLRDTRCSSWYYHISLFHVLDLIAKCLRGGKQ